MGSIVDPFVSAEVSGLEVFNHIPSPEHVDVVGVDFLGDHSVHRIVVLVQDEVVVKHHIHVGEFDTHVVHSVLVTFFRSRTVPVACRNDGAVEAIFIGRQGTGEGLVEFVGSFDGDGSASDTRGAVLFEDITGEDGITAHINSDGVAVVRLTFVIQGGDVVFITVHVVFQS